MVGGENQQIARPHRLEQVGQAPVEILQAAVEVDRIVAVPPEHVGLDEIDEDQAGFQLLEQRLGLLDSLDVRLRRVGLVDVLAREDVGDLPDSVHFVAGFPDQRQVVGTFRLERKIVSVRSSLVVAGLARERPRDHASDRVLAGEELPGNPAPFVKLLERDRVLVSRDLEDGIRRRVDDPLVGA